MLSASDPSSSTRHASKPSNLPSRWADLNEIQLKEDPSSQKSELYSHSTRSHCYRDNQPSNLPEPTTRTQVGKEFGHSKTLSRKKSLRKSLARRATLSANATMRAAKTVANQIAAKANSMVFNQPTIHRKLVCVGDGGIGKTSMLTYYSTGRFPEEYTPTIFENYVTTASIDDCLVELALWDTAGQEDYNRLRVLSYPDTDCVILCFSVDLEESVVNVKHRWLRELQLHCPNVPIILVGLKADLRDNFIRKMRCIPPDAGKKLADFMGATAYLECSSKTGEGVAEVIECAARSSLLPKVRRVRQQKHEKCLLM